MEGEILGKRYGVCPQAVRRSYPFIKLIKNTKQCVILHFFGSA